MKAILSGERRTLGCLIFWLAGSFTAGPSSDVSGERDLAARVALVAPNPVWPRSSALDARLEKETGLDEADQLGDERRLRSMRFFEAIADNDRDTLCKMLNEGMEGAPTGPGKGATRRRAAICRWPTAGVRHALRSVGTPRAAAGKPGTRQSPTPK